MKKLCALALAVLMMFLCACGEFVSIYPGTELNRTAPVNETEDDASFEAKPLLSFMRLDSFAENYYSDTPIALSCQTEAAEGGLRGCRSYVFDRASIITACDALREMTLTGVSEEEPTPGEEFILSMADGTEYAFSFSVLSDGTYVLKTGSKAYTLTGGDALWDIAFPAYSGDFDVFDLYFSDEIRRFADDFYENTPVSVGYRLSSGATITSEDPEIISSAFQALSQASVTVVEDHPDQNIDLTQTRDFIFTMEDGTYYTFSFAQQCLAVQAVSNFDTVYYWLGDIEPLFQLQIRSESNIGAFEGGTVADMRDDIRTTAAVISGENTDLTVAGVFVQYEIDDESGYLTLSGETAVSFLQTALGVSVSAEPVEAPEGSWISISVTLSDLSGPILYFTGDTIQQYVGMNYSCDAGDMDALRSMILQLAADGNNTAEVTDAATD